MTPLQDKVAIVTGGSRGIGRGIVQTLAAQGAKVLFSYRSSATAAEELVAELGLGDQVQHMKSDAANYEDAQALVEHAIAQFGGVDILVNNAGIAKDGLLMRMTPEQWDQVMDVNLKSVFNMTKHVIRPMMKKRAGSIINITSVVGVFGNAGQSNYAASKAGIIGFTKSIAKEVGSRSIRCNAIAPGFIRTDMTDALDEKTRDAYLVNVPLGRFGEAEEVAQTVAFLGSDASTYITGQVLSVCGGINI